MQILKAVKCHCILIPNISPAMSAESSMRAVWKVSRSLLQEHLCKKEKIKYIQMIKFYHSEKICDFFYRVPCLHDNFQNQKVGNILHFFIHLLLYLVTSSFYCLHFSELVFVYVYTNTHICMSVLYDRIFSHSLLSKFSQLPK